MFEGVCPVVNTPFFEDGSIDYASLDRTLDFVTERGCGSVCLFAFNSEPYKLSLDEKKETIRRFSGSLCGRAKMLIGLVENSISDVTTLGQTAAKCGADGIILYPPALSTPQEDGLIGYFKTIADAVGLPVMIQDNPRSTGVNMSTDLLKKAYSEIPLFRHIKIECPFPTRKMASLIRDFDGQLACYSGNGGIFAIEAFLTGASGIMPGVVLCGAFQKLFTAFKSGDIDKARRIFERLLPLTWFEDQSLEFYISCEKLLLFRMGIISSPAVRQPCVHLTDSEETELYTLFDRIIDLV